METIPRETDTTPIPTGGEGAQIDDYTSLLRSLPVWRSPEEEQGGEQQPDDETLRSAESRRERIMQGLGMAALRAQHATETVRAGWQKVRDGYWDVTMHASFRVLNSRAVERLAQNGTLAEEERTGFGRLRMSTALASAAFMNMMVSRVTGTGLFDGTEDVALQASASPPVVSSEQVVRLGFGTGLQSVDMQELQQAAGTVQVETDPPLHELCEPGQIRDADDPGCALPGPGSLINPGPGLGFDFNFDLFPDADVDVDAAPLPDVDVDITPAPVPDIDVDVEPTPDADTDADEHETDNQGTAAPRPPEELDRDAAEDEREAQDDGRAEGNGSIYDADPLPGEWLWDWMERIGVPRSEIMPRLEEAAAELERTTGRHVEWEGCEYERRLTVDGHTDTPYLADALRPYLANDM